MIVTVLLGTIVLAVISPALAAGSGRYIPRALAAVTVAAAIPLGLETCAITAAFSCYILCVSHICRKGGPSLLMFAYILTVAPSFIHFLPFHILRSTGFSVLYLDPMFAISYSAGHDMARLPFTYTRSDVADYFFFQHDTAFFCLVYLLIGTAILGAAYVLTLFKAGTVQADRQEGTGAHP